MQTKNKYRVTLDATSNTRIQLSNIWPNFSESLHSRKANAFLSLQSRACFLILMDAFVVLYFALYTKFQCRCTVSRLALHRAAMPNIFLSFFYFFLLVCLRRLCTLLPPLCVILVFIMCIRVLLLYASKITHTYFYFFIRAR